MMTLLTNWAKLKWMVVIDLLRIMKMLVEMRIKMDKVLLLKNAAN